MAGSHLRFSTKLASLRWRFFGVLIAEIPQRTIDRLGLLYDPILAGFGIVSVWCARRYHLTLERHEEIMRALENKRRERSAEAA